MEHPKPDATDSDKLPAQAFNLLHDYPHHKQQAPCEVHVGIDGGSCAGEWRLLCRSPRTMSAYTSTLGLYHPECVLEP